MTKIPGPVHLQLARAERKLKTIRNSFRLGSVQPKGCEVAKQLPKLMETYSPLVLLSMASECTLLHRLLLPLMQVYLFVFPGSMYLPTPCSSRKDRWCTTFSS